MYDMGENEIVEHMFLDSEKYDIDIMEMMHITLKWDGKLNKWLKRMNNVTVVSGTVWRNECMDD